ncbi:MAG: tRNA 2-thiocytidine(32) synthetase TtcA [Moraxellaceae bacterium]|jgi:tRNA 2-thiocytidine biosynthesis protein TtcA|nr:tRNA 2-thiocytidine(32) synthetase TtcA [Moraxellaceae bacterium]
MGRKSAPFSPLPVVVDVSTSQTPVVFYPESLAAIDADEEMIAAESLVIPGGDEPATGTPDHLDKKSRTEFNKLQKRLRRNVGQAITDYNMIEEGDKVMVCLSGGKDSYTMLEILLNLQISAPVKFEIVAVNLDQKQPGFPEDVLPAYLTKRGVPFYILEKDTYSIVKELTPEGKTFCAVCSRLRRGNLYAFAQEIGATKVALGHHRDDLLATLFLNLFHGGKLKAMPPKLLSDDGKNILIRPLAYCKEKDIIEFAKLKGFPIIPCNLCGSQENLQRAAINQMLRDWDRQYPQRLESMFTALQNVAPSQLADRELFDFVSLKATPGAGKSADDARLDVVNLSL